MARIAFLLALLSATIATSVQAQSPLDATKPQLTLCQGNFALCAAATCTLTGRTFPGTQFQEVMCKCPVIDGQALADVTGGNMQGSCAPPIDPVTKKAGVWSLFWPMLNIPQEVNGRWRKNVPALPHNCPATTGDPAEPVLFGQCFSYSCTNVRKVNGVLIADCYCPAEYVQSSTKTEFAVQAGQCQSSVCSQVPVGAPFIVPGNICDNR
ncbi:MAG TPA: hypothetical protein VGF48_06025 [Thermoanaerobaculia bacterium]|jgi:hypothetical protein